jgi:hypothetical protein
MDYCEKLLCSDDYEDWLMSINILVAVGTPEAVDRLILVYAQSLNDERRHVLCMVAKILTAVHVKPFSIMVREVACPGELDVSGWTKTAISTLKDVCRRFGIETYGNGDVMSDNHEINPSDSQDIDEISTMPDR